MGNQPSRQALYRRDNTTQTERTTLRPISVVPSHAPVTTTAGAQPNTTPTTYHCRLTSRKHATLNLEPTHTQHGQGTHFAYFTPRKTIAWCEFDTVVLTAYQEDGNCNTPCAGLTVPVSAFTLDRDVVVDGKTWVQFTAHSSTNDTNAHGGTSGRLLVRTRKRRKDSGDTRSSVLGLSVATESGGIGNAQAARWMHEGREWVLVWERSRRVVG